MPASVGTNTTPLRALRKSRHLSLAQVAAATGTDTGNLSRIERGLQTPSQALAKKLVGYFGSSISELHIFFPEKFADSLSVGEQSGNT